MSSQKMRVIYVEKKQPFTIEASHLLHELNKIVGVKELKHVRMLIKYLITGVDDKTFKASLNTIFSEPPVDLLYLEKFPISPQEIAFGVMLSPGQFDQRADSAEQCIKLLSPNSRPQVKVVTVYALTGNIPTKALDRIKQYLINSIDSLEVNAYTHKYQEHVSTPRAIEVIYNFNIWTKSQLTTFHKKNKLAMSLQDLILIQNYFKKENRLPTITEIKVIDTYWSDHCRHTTFETKIDSIDIKSSRYTHPIKKAYRAYLKSRKYVYGHNTARKISLMDLATIFAKELFKRGKLKDVDVSDENNACSIKVDVTINNAIHKYLLMFKNETHNHPTEIEPFGGASTCLGGAIRDPLSGRTYVYQAMRVTGSADPTTSITKTIPNKLPQRTITLGATRGYSSYGNQIGLATGQVNEVYHPGYVAKHMEVGAVVGAAPITNVVRKKPIKGDVIILLGGRTGKDGIGGATGSSKSHNNKSLHEMGAEVQKGNPICERKIQRLFMRADVTRLIKKCNDFGAGGASVAIGELCSGVDINLDLIPKKYLGLNGTELAISESQERMAVVVSNNDVNTFIDLANQENLEATVVAKVMDTNRLRMYWNQTKIVDLSRDFLNTNGALQHANIKILPITKNKLSNVSDKQNIKVSWNKMLTDLNVCIKLGMIQRFDSTIGANTALMPLGGKNQLTPAEGMAALIPSFNNKKSETASLMSYGFNPTFSNWSPFHMAYYSVIESITKIVAMGGEWRKIHLSFQEYFEKLKQDRVSWGKPFAALLGAYAAQKEMGLGAIGGKDSMSGTYEKINVPPTLISFAVTTGLAKNIISPEFKMVNSTIALIYPKVNLGKTIDFKCLQRNYDVVHQGIVNKQIVSAYSFKHFGLSEGLSKMSIGNDIGVEFFNVNKDELFEQNYGTIIVEIPHNHDVTQVLKNSNYKIIGKTINQPYIVSKQLSFKININDVKEKITSKLSNIFIHSTPKDNSNIDLQPYHCSKPWLSKKIVKKPLVVIPVFPGTNCEYDSQYAFERVGAIVKQVLIRNNSTKSLLESINELVEAIKTANILMLPGGFSAADEPDGSAKFIVNVFNNPRVKKTTTELLTHRDGLILGICNGFQALIKLGLLPYGKIQQPSKNSPTLTFNKISHHMSTIVRTKVISNNSPWLASLKPNDIHMVPISHGEGRFVADKKQIKQMEQNGQIITQYIDWNDSPTMNMPYNPNGSMYAIEAIASLDGKILGKMGHSERIGENLYRNVLGEHDQKIFENGVKYFTHKL